MDIEILEAVNGFVIEMPVAEELSARTATLLSKKKKVVCSSLEELISKIQDIYTYKNIT